MGIKDSIIRRYAGTIREKAIARAKARIALSGRAPRDLTQDELEIIVKEEEDKIKQVIYGSGVAALMLVLGLS